VKVGVWIPCYRRWVRRDETRRLAQSAEALGFASLWVQDHLVAPVGDADTTGVELQASWLEPDDYGNARFSAVEYYGEENWWLDPYALWGFLAGCTETCELGSGVIVLPYRHPIAQAKMLGTLGVPYGERGLLTDEYLAVIRTLLAGQETEFQGRTIRFGRVRPLIGSVQVPHPPFFIGGASRRAIERAVDHGDGWLPAHVAPGPLRRGLDYLRDYAASRGRPVPEVAVSLVWGLRDPRVPAPPRGRRALQSVDEVADRIVDYAALGVGRLAIDLPNPNLAVALRQMELLAEAAAAAGALR
jgi:alkanesulfonate monooxygenase SsuD/methylene tetrahydromethanopterin reductase-like flavin-dependent oxidoreductase (luciferase family)